MLFFFSLAQITLVLVQMHFLRVRKMALFSHLMKDVLSTLLPFAHFLEVAFFGCIRKQDRSYFDSKTRRFKTALCQKCTKIFQKNYPKKISQKFVQSNTRSGILFPKLFWPSVRNFFEISITRTIYLNNERSEQFFKQNAFLTIIPGGFSDLIYVQFNWKKYFRLRNMQEKLEN